MNKKKNEKQQQQQQKTARPLKMQPHLTLTLTHLI